MADLNIKQENYFLKTKGAFTYYVTRQGGRGGQQKCDYPHKGDRKMRDVRGGGGPKSLKIA